VRAGHIAMVANDYFLVHFLTTFVHRGLSRASLNTTTNRSITCFLFFRDFGMSDGLLGRRPQDLRSAIKLLSKWIVCRHNPLKIHLI